MPAMSGRNRLAGETSPYLLQHADNPVDWYPWGEEAFARARAENKPVLVSIGYSACHWCHVMAHESFENPEIAARMNELFVNVKVDREERPDVDDVYMKAVQLLTGRGGWPLTVFCAPDGKPFHGGTYFPPTDRHGMPGFPRVLQAVAQAYRERPDEVARASGQLVAGVRRFEDVAGEPHALDPALPARAADALLAHVDTQYGGLGGAPKFPHSQVLLLLLRQYRRTRRPELLEAVRITCERMAAGGIYDQLGGGFHRYAVDARWLVPHFEKMLYDNAQIPRLYLEAFQVTHDPGLRRIVVETLDYVLADLRHPDGAFFSATDADSEGEEGRYFVWTRAEVAQVVDPGDLELVCRYWDITDEGNFEGRNILHLTVTVEQVARLFGRTVEDAAAAIARARQRLLDVRRRRVPPLRDEKILTAWNALMIGTLAEAGRVLRVPRYVAAAAEAARFLWSALRRDGRLLHVWASGEARQGAFLDDHAFLANALLDLYEADGDPVHIGRARELIAALDAHFHDPAGAYYFTGDDAEALIARPKPAADGALPSGNAVAAHALLRLAALTGEDRYRARAEEILGRFQAAATQQPLGFATHLQALEFAVEGPTEVVVVSPPGGDGGAALWSEVAGVYLPHHVLVAARADDPEPLPLARDRPPRDGRATAYVCRNFSCSAPVVDPTELRRLLET